MGGGARKRGTETSNTQQGDRSSRIFRAETEDNEERPPDEPLADEVRGPFEMIERSHRRLEEQLSDLQQAAGAIVRERATSSELTTVDSVLAFLEKSAARHEQDEDESLFPRLRQLTDLVPLLDDLGAEHVLHGHLVKQLRSLRNRWPPSGPDAGDGAALVILANELARLYRAHIEREERELLPIAREHIGPEERKAMQMEMDRRRGVGDRSGRNGGGHGGGRRRMPAGSTGPRIREF